MSSARQVYVDALTAMFCESLHAVRQPVPVAVFWKELRAEVVAFFNAVVRNLVLQAILEQTSCDETTDKSSNSSMDSSVLVEAIANACADSGKEFMHSSVLAFTLIKDTAVAVLGSMTRVGELRLLHRLVTRLCALCYESAYFTRLGGCAALNFLLHHTLVVTCCR